MLTSSRLLAAAREGHELKVARVNAVIAALEGGRIAQTKTAAEPAVTQPRKKRNELSQESWQRFAAAQKKRWAKERKVKG
jgi:antitoxin (DNA-binding transcriptional repressor) of toxin-antitoxin stability system